MAKISMSGSKITVEFDKSEIQGGGAPQRGEVPPAKRGSFDPSRECPVCGGKTKEWQGNAKETGRPYHFWGCQSKTCKTTVNIPVGPACPKCGRPMNEKTGKKGKFYSCCGYKAGVCDGTLKHTQPAPAPTPQFPEQEYEEESFGFGEESPF